MVGFCGGDANDCMGQAVQLLVIVMCAVPVLSCPVVKVSLLLPIYLSCSYMP